MAYEIFRGGSWTSMQVDRDLLRCSCSQAWTQNLTTFRTGLSEGNVKIIEKESTGIFESNEQNRAKIINNVLQTSVGLSFFEYLLQRTHFLTCKFWSSFWRTWKNWWNENGDGIFLHLHMIFLNCECFLEHWWLLFTTHIGFRFTSFITKTRLSLSYNKVSFFIPSSNIVAFSKFSIQLKIDE